MQQALHEIRQPLQRGLGAGDPPVALEEALLEAVVLLAQLAHHLVLGLERAIEPLLEFLDVDGLLLARCPLGQAVAQTSILRKTLILSASSSGSDGAIMHRHKVRLSTVDGKGTHLFSRVAVRDEVFGFRAFGSASGDGIGGLRRISILDSLKQSE